MMVVVVLNNGLKKDLRRETKAKNKYEDRSR